MSGQIVSRGRRVTSAATPETATGGHRSSKQHYTRQARQSKAHLFRGFLVAPDQAIIGIRYGQRSGLWEVDTPAGTLTCSTKGLVWFKRFRNRCSYRLHLTFSSRPTQAEWLGILNDAVRELLEESRRAEGCR